MINVEYRWSIGIADKAHRFASLAVEVLVPGVEWNRKERALLPFEVLLFAVVEPDAGGAAAFEDVDHFFEHLFLGIQFFSRGNLTDVGRRVGRFSGMAQNDVAAQAAPAPPRRNRELSDIADDEISDNGKLFPIEKLVEGSFFAVGFFCIALFIFHCWLPLKTCSRLNPRGLRIYVCKDTADITLALKTVSI